MKKEQISTLVVATFIIQIIGYAYMTSQLSYFNVNMSFYQYNLFNDFFNIFITGLCLSIPVLGSLLSSIIIWNYFPITKTIQIIKRNKKNIAIHSAIIIAAIILPIIFTKYIYKYLLLDFINYTLIHIVCILVFLIGIKMYYYIKEEIKNNSKPLIIDKVFAILYIITIIIITVEFTGKFGTSISQNKKDFLIIDNNYISLYNTNDYAIVSKYQIDYETNSVTIYNDNIIKIDLTNKIINNYKFDNVIIKR